MKLHDRHKLLLRLLLLIAMGLFLLFWVKMGWSCLFRRATGIPCLCCGMSRAWVRFFRWDLAGAFAGHPMFWSVPVLGLLWLFVDSIPQRWTTWLSLGIALGYFVCYVIRLIAFFGGVGV